jgi:hypothetical protein
LLPDVLFDNRPMLIRPFLAISALMLLASAVHAQGTVYRCPGPPVLYTDALSAREAADKGCRTIEGTPITVVQAPRPRSGAPADPNAKPPGDARIDANQQKFRDTERRRLLEAELRATEDRLSAARAEFNNGQGERRGDERNYQRYLDRMAGLKDSITRLEGDVQALKREISKLP